MVKGGYSGKWKGVKRWEMFLERRKIEEIRRPGGQEHGTLLSVVLLWCGACVGAALLPNTYRRGCQPELA